jgi:hypothetical protein
MERARSLDMQANSMFLKRLREQGEPLQTFLLHHLACGIIEVGEDADIGLFRNQVIPEMALSTKLKALVRADHKVPIITAFAPTIYQGYENNNYVNLLKLVNPLLEEEMFVNIKSIHREQGTLYFFRTNEKVV